MTVNKNEKTPKEMFVLKKSCSPNGSFISNADKRLIKFADTEKRKKKPSVVPVLMVLYMFVLQSAQRAFHISSLVFYHSATKSLFLFTQPACIKWRIVHIQLQ